MFVPGGCGASPLHDWSLELFTRDFLQAGGDGRVADPKFYKEPRLYSFVLRRRRN